MLNSRNLRHTKLKEILSDSPMITDSELASRLGVSISTVRLDRALMGVPELRERIKTMAQNAVSKLQSLSPSEVIGELLELEPDKWALSVLKTAKDMAVRFTDIVSDNYVYSQASSIAVAAIHHRLHARRVQRPRKSRRHSRCPRKGRGQPRRAKNRKRPHLRRRQRNFRGKIHHRDSRVRGGERLEHS